MDAANIRMRNPLSQLDLRLEAREHVGVRGESWPNRFQSNAFTEMPILGLVNIAHSARRNKANDAETASQQFTATEVGASTRRIIDGARRSALDGWLRGEDRLNLDP